MSTQPSTRVPEWTLGDRLRKSREAEGMTQRDLAAAVGIARNSVGNYELGETQPRPLVLREWARITHVPVEWLAFGVENGPDDGPAVQPAGYTVFPPLRLVA